MQEITYPDYIEKIEVKDSGGIAPFSGLRSLPVADRPRERLISGGVQSLADRELLAILLNVGIRGKNVIALAQELLEYLDRKKEIPSVEELCMLTGVGEGKACSIVAMLEFGRRKWGVTGVRVKHPSDTFALVRHHADRRQEQFICLSLNGAHELLAIRIVTIGLVNRTIVHPREVYADPLLDRACAVIVAHNHPSGNLVPSPEDNDITYRLKTAADILGIHFLDHLIFSQISYFSYRQQGRLE
ncbi:DNA repair protein RadC [Spirochaetia bacterium]|nr:DNA repair protein RadC [Spirochaetia bacterium]